MSFRSPRSIRGLLVVLVTILVIPLVGLTSLFGYRADQTAQKLVEERMMASAEAASSGIDRFIHDAEHLFKALVQDPAVRSLDPSRCRDLPGYVRTLVHPTYTNVATWTTEGTPVCSLLPSPDSLDMQGVPGFADALRSDTFFITPVQVGRRSGKWSVQFTYPIRDDDGTRVGMLSAPVDLVHFDRILQSLALRDEVPVLTLLEPDGTVVARSRNSTTTVGHLIPNTRFEDVAAGRLPARGLVQARSLEGEEYVFAYVLIPGFNWVVTAGQPSGQVYGPVRTGRIRLLFLGVALLLGASVAGTLVYRRITTPLRALLQGISAARPGEAAGLPTDGPEEVAWVADRFNRAWGSWAEAERDKARSNERIHSLVTDAVTGIYVSTADDRFLEVNQAMVDLLGYEGREELLSTAVHTIYGSEEVRRRYVAEYGARETFRGVPADWRKKDGETVKVRLSGRRITHKNGGIAWQIIVDDVTELTHLQAQYLQAQKMEALGRLAGGIAHDFNNVLTVVQGQSDLLREEPGMDEECRSQLQEISNAAARGSALTKQLLAFGRRSPIQKTSTDINEVLRGVEIMLRRMAGEEVELSLELDPDLGPVWVNRSQIEQVAMNLCVNARDAMREGGRLTVRTYECRVTAAEAREHADAQEGPHVVLAVTDTGHGIDPGVLAHMFEPFFTTKPESKGTGLGLSTVYGIVTDAGGHIRVESQPGAGTTIGIFLPRDQGEWSRPRFGTGPSS